MPRCHSVTAFSSAFGSLDDFKKELTASLRRFRAFFTRLRSAFSRRRCTGAVKARGQTPLPPAASLTRAMARSSGSESLSSPVTSLAFTIRSAPARELSSVSVCREAASFSSERSSSLASLSNLSLAKRLISRSNSSFSFSAWAACRSFCACSCAFCLANSRCCSFRAFSSSSCFFCLSSAFFAFNSSFFSCCRLAASAAAASFLRCSSFFFFSSALSAANRAFSAACCSSTIRILAWFSLALRRSSLDSRWFGASSWESVGPLVVLCASSLTFIGVRPMDSMALWKMLAAASGLLSFKDSSIWLPNSLNCSSLNCKHTSFSCSRTTWSLTAGWKLRSRCRHFFTRSFTASLLAFSSLRFCSSARRSASSASRCCRSASSLARLAAVRSSSRRAASASRASRLASFSA
mmetsp:Transcript_87792/g.209801  ORF Transcript_87792/g.209801 Transcript_87792/m.209801 type:complete len:408 (+) Transcript_87792:247-1470(+)